MGKAKKLRSNSHKKKVPPTGGLTQAEVDEYASLPREQAEMFQGLTNIQGSIREAACMTLASIYGDVHSESEERKLREKLNRMIEIGLFKKLIPLVVDPLKMVRLHALGALRNISVTGGIDICELLVTHNVMTPIVRVVAESATVEQFEKKDLQAVQILEQAISLLVNVCESSQVAITELTRGNLLDPIMLIAKHCHGYGALHIATLKLLLLITESNPTLNQVFSHNAHYQTVLGELIQADQQSVSLYTRLHAVGIALNIKAIVQNETNVAKLLPIIEESLQYDAVNVVQLAQAAALQWDLAHKSVYDDNSAHLEPITEQDKENMSQAQAKIRQWKESVQTMNLALELVADMAAPGSDENEIEEEWASDDEDAMEQYAAGQMNTDSAASDNAFANVLRQSKVFSLSVTILQGLVSIPPLSEPAITHDFEKMRIRVCNALTNLVQVLPWKVVGEGETLVQLFRHFCMLYRNLKTTVEDGAPNSSPSSVFEFDGTCSMMNDVETATSAAMWSVLRRSSAAKQQLAIAAYDATLIMTTARQSSSVDTRLNTVGMLGCVGQQSRDMNENAAIGRCLLSSLSDPSLEVVTETLNALFDVYSDEDFDANFKAIGFLPALEHVATAMKAKLRAEQKQMDRDLVAHVKETQLNLVRFIKYKKKHCK